ncbi:MAG: hypothetical protein JWQ05_721 [Methylobacterium sp.]|jgi:hypothetical protein|nr:hypothetical protein [Methylobacterium sp.]
MAGTIPPADDPAPPGAAGARLDVPAVLVARMASGQRADPSALDPGALSREGRRGVVVAIQLTRLREGRTRGKTGLCRRETLGCHVSAKEESVPAGNRWNKHNFVLYLDNIYT